MLVCKSPCVSSEVVAEKLQCCDITKALWYGKNSGAYKSAYDSPCCPYDYSCYNLDIQYIWYRDAITCTVYGREMAFEPVPTDIVIQEEFDTIESLNQVQGLLKNLNKNNQIKMPTRVKVIAPTTRQNSHNYRDGPIKISDHPNQYLTYPSMIKGDKSCFQRVKNNAICSNLVGGVLQKLAFYDRVHFNPTQNKPKFPSSPVRLYGSNGEISKPPDDPKRKKRLITGGVVLLTFLTSLVGNAITGTAIGLTLQQEFDEKLNELESKINERFAQDEQNIKTLSNRINSLEAVNVVQDQAITRALTRTLILQAIQSSKDDFLQEEIDSNRRLLLQHLDTYLRQTQTLDSISLAELELDRLIISEVASRNGIDLFDDATTYLTKTTQGNLYLKKYAQETRILHSHLYNVTVADKEKMKDLRRNLTSIKNETKDIIKMIKHADSLVPIPINLPEARWNPPNISINFTQTDITPKQLADNLLSGLGIVPRTMGGLMKTGVDEIANITGSGIEQLLKPLLPILIPAAVIAVAIVFFCCFFQFHPKCAKNRRKLTPSWLKKDKKERKMHIEDMMKPPQRKTSLKSDKKKEYTKGHFAKNF